MSALGDTMSKSVKMMCSANTQGITEITPVLYQPSEDPNWPSDLEIPETLVVISPGSSSRATR